MEPTPGLRVPDFPFSSPLTTYAIALERHRTNLGPLLVKNNLLTELAYLRRFIASITSARIEGNRTTVLGVVSGATAADKAPGSHIDENVSEVLNLEKAASFVDKYVQKGTILNHSLIRTLHSIAVEGLTHEGDKTPGSYRTGEVAISGSAHRPPLAINVHSYMSDLLDFANAHSEPHYQLVRMAIAHHRFVWIHPFGNGNGRVARLFSYAMLRAMGFASPAGLHSVNPTAVFGTNRDDYYRYLAQADDDSDDSLVQWCTYVLQGLTSDMEKLLEIANDDTLQEIIIKAASAAERRNALTPEAAEVVRLSSDGNYRKAGELEAAIPGTPTARSRTIGSLLNEQLLVREGPHRRRYRIRLAPNPLTPFLFRELDARGFLPAIVRDPE